MKEPFRPDAARAEFERIALPVAPALYRTARRLASRTDDAPDLVQETFLRAYRTFENFRDGTNAKAWLFTILYSILTNRWQREQRVREEPLGDDIDQRFGQLLADNWKAAERRLMASVGASREIEAALESLPAEYRAAVLLVDVEELTYEEAATALGCPVGTVRSRLARGRRLLFVALHDYAVRVGALKAD